MTYYQYINKNIDSKLPDCHALLNMARRGNFGTVLICLVCYFAMLTLLFWGLSGLCQNTRINRLPRTASGQECAALASL